MIGINVIDQQRADGAAERAQLLFRSLQDQKWPHRRQYQPMLGKIEAHVRRYAVQLLVKRDGAIDFAFANVDPNQHAWLTQR